MPNAAAITPQILSDLLENIPNDIRSDSASHLIDRIRTTGDFNEQIDRLNELVFEIRFKDPHIALSLCEGIHQLLRPHPYPLGKANCLRGLSTCHYMLANYEQARDFAEQASELFHELGHQKGESYALNALGVIHGHLGDYAAALKTHLQSLGLRRHIDDKAGQAVSLNNIGLIYWQLSDFESALSHFMESLSLKQELGEKISDILLNIGNIYHDLNQNEEALSYYDRCYDIARDQDDPWQVTRVLGNIGVAYQELGQYETALQYQTRFLEASIQLGNKEWETIAYNNLGNVYEKLNDSEQARGFFEKGLELNRQTGNKHLQVTSLYNLWHIFFNQSEYETALVYLKEAEQVAEDIQAQQSLYEVYEALSRTYEKMGQIEAALTFYRAFHELKETVFDAMSRHRFQHLQIRYQVEQTRQQAEIYRQEAEIQRIRNVELANTMHQLEQTKERLLSSQQELREMNRELRHTLKQLADVNREKDEFVDMVVHDLKNPLFIIDNVAQILRDYFDKLQPEQIKHYQGVLQSTVQRMFSLINDILDLSAIESGHRRFHPQKFNLAAVVEEVRQDFELQAHGKGLTLAFEEANTLWTAFADPLGVRNVLENLISNAIKYSPSGSEITLRLVSIDSMVRCEVSDQGPGLSEDDQEKLFRRFARLSVEPTAGEQSTGLGLSIVKRLVDAMDGQVGCRSTIGQGSTFYFDLPTPA